jgi:hypothetical protein
MTLLGVPHHHPRQPAGDARLQARCDPRQGKVWATIGNENPIFITCCIELNSAMRGGFSAGQTIAVDRPSAEPADARTLRALAEPSSQDQIVD